MEIEGTWKCLMSEYPAQKKKGEPSRVKVMSYDIGERSIKEVAWNLV
jgi:hypothetical protein